MGLLSPCVSQFTTNIRACTIEYDSVDGQELKWEFNEECGRMYVTFPDD